MIAINKPLFSPGKCVATPGAMEAMEKAGHSATEFIDRHGDWGDVCEEDAESNDRALEDGSRILSVYHTKKDDKLWCITEADRSSTCIILPEEY